MLNWISVYKRMLQLYNVKTQQELGMALGVPVKFSNEDASHGEAIPWAILELIVSEKRVSWDWLLTGKENVGSGAPIRRDAPATVSILAVREAKKEPPRFRTRELERVLLTPALEDDPEDEGTEAAALNAATKEKEQPRDDGIVRELEHIRNKMLREIERVEQLIEDHKA